MVALEDNARVDPEVHANTTNIVTVTSTAMSDATRELNSITISKVSASRIRRTLLEEGFRPPVNHFTQAFL